MSDLVKSLAESRALVISLAEGWIGTPFEFGQRCKGAGVDCANFIAAVFEEAGVFSAPNWGFFARDWHTNTSTEHYLFRLMKHAAKLPAGQLGQPGDIVLGRVAAKVFSQSGILANNGWVIQAYPGRGVCRARLDSDPMWVGWEKAYFDPWRKDVQSTS